MFISYSCVVWSFNTCCGVGGAILQSCITDWPCVVGSPTFADIL